MMNIFAGKAFHGLVVKSHIDLLVQDQAIVNALMTMYCKFGFFQSAEKLFETASDQGIEPWSIMVSGLGRPGMEERCIKYLREMQDAGIQSDSRNVVSIITSCSRLRLKDLGKSLHCYVMKRSMDEDVSIANSLIDLYGSLRDLEVARRIFLKMNRDLVSWNSMMSSYNQNQQYKDAIALFDEMRARDLRPNHATLVTALTACSNVAGLNKGKSIHQYIKEEGIDIDLPLATAMIDMYAKNGKLDAARQLFDLIEERDVISWNVMIFSFGMHGDAKAAFETFQHMENSNVRTNALTFLGLLSACAHTRELGEGLSIFSKMQHYSVKPESKRYSCLVELLGKTNDFKEAEQLILSMHPMRPCGLLY